MIFEGWEGEGQGGGAVLLKAGAGLYGNPALGFVEAKGSESGGLGGLGGLGGREARRELHFTQKPDAFTWEPCDGVC